MKRYMLLVLAVAIAPARGDLTGQWRAGRPVAIPSISAPGLVYCPLDEGSLAAVDSFAEYRIVRDGNVEVPYRMLDERGRAETYALTSKTVAQSPPGAEPELVTLDLGDRPASRLRLTVGLTGDDFRCRATVEGSDDGKAWQVLVNMRLLFRQQDGMEQREIALPFRNDRFLRLRLVREQGRLPRIDRVQVSSEAFVRRRLVLVTTTLSKQENTKERRTVLVLDTGRRTRDVVEARFQIGEAAFDRSVEVETLEQGTNWEPRGSGSLKRLAAGGEVSLPLDIPQTRKLRFTVYNGDDAPLTIRDVKLLRARRGLLFSAEPGKRYELWYGRQNAIPPSYEMERLPLTVPPSELPMASLGAERRLPVPPPAPKPKPAWSELHPWPFWGAMTTVVALLLLLIVRSMHGAGRPPTGIPAPKPRA